MKLWFLSLYFLIAFSASVFAEDSVSFEYFVRGNAAFSEGRYEEAISNYRAILDAGAVNSTLYYNLGNAYAKAGQKGMAIVSYERALRLDPLDMDVRHNLEWIRLQAEDKIAPRGTSWFAAQAERFLGLWSAQKALETAFALNILFFLLAVWAFLRKSLRARLGPFLWALGILFLSAALIAALVSWREQAAGGVVIAKEVQVHFAPSARDQIAFVLHEGASFQIRSRAPGWVRVRLADGKTGWLNEEAIEEI